MSVSVSQRQFGVGGIRPMNDRERCGRRERINSGFYTSVSSMELELWVLHLCVMHGTGTLGSDVRWLSFLHFSCLSGYAARLHNEGHSGSAWGNHLALARVKKVLSRMGFHWFTRGAESMMSCVQR